MLHAALKLCLPQIPKSSMSNSKGTLAKGHLCAYPSNTITYGHVQCSIIRHGAVAPFMQCDLVTPIIKATAWPTVPERAAVEPRRKECHRSGGTQQDHGARRHSRCPVEKARVRAGVCDYAQCANTMGKSAIGPTHVVLFRNVTSTGIPSSLTWYS